MDADIEFLVYMILFISAGLGLGAILAVLLIYL